MIPQEAQASSARETGLTDERLAEIAARADAATKGPWGIYEYGGGSLLDIAADLKDTGTGYRARRTIARLEDEPLDNDPTHKEWTAEDDWAQVKADAAFVAHAREDVDLLRAELAAVRAERDQARALVAELEAEREKLVRWHGEDSKTITGLVARVDRRRARLVALQNDALSMRGSLAPADGDRKVPFELGETLTPAVDWLIARVAELEALKPAPIQTCRVCGAGYSYGQPCSTCEFKARMAAETGGAS